MTHGRAESVSAWVNEALRHQLVHERRLSELSALIEDYESEHGVISPLEMEQAARAARSRAVVVRGEGR